MYKIPDNVYKDRLSYLMLVYKCGHGKFNTLKYL